MVHPIGRLAPTPSGQLHLGNVCAFAAAWLSIRNQAGELLLRVEDIDATRARADVEADQRRELEWLGLEWDRETPRQSEREYDSVIEALGSQWTYRCVCTRAQIKRDGDGVYPGTCRDAGHTTGALRFKLRGGEVHFVDRKWGARSARPADFGDPVLQRKDGVQSYNLAVVADDIRDGVTEVVRGADLLDYSAVQIELWRALGHAPPTWMHAPLVVGRQGHKLSKSHASSHVGALRALGWSPRDIWRVVLPWLGLEGVDELSEAAARFAPASGPLGPIVVELERGAEPQPREGIKWHPADATDNLR